MKTQDVEVGADQVNINMEYKAGSIQCWVKSQHRFLKEEEELFFLSSSLKSKPNPKPSLQQPRLWRILNTRQLQRQLKAGRTTRIVCRLLFF
jgi:hypothetical protein